jgi:putative spermidine/putrescine transport system permease protein
MSDRLKLVLLLTPALLVIGGLFGLGLMTGLLRSLNVNPALGLIHPDLHAYREVLADAGFLRSFGLSVYIAAVSTVGSALFAVPAALLLRRSFVGRGVVSFLFQLNLTIPHLVGAIGILYLLSQSGSFARLGFAVGLISRPAQFPALLFDPYAVGIILQYMWKEVPFIGLILLANLQAINGDYEGLARSLGASRTQALCHVILPLIWPGLASAAVIVFAFTFGAYEVPLVLGANAPVTLPVLAYRSYTEVDLAARPQAMAMAMVITVMSAAMIALYLRLGRARIRH